jgi:hypothetical protein
VVSGSSPLAPSPAPSNPPAAAMDRQAAAVPAPAPAPGAGAIAPEYLLSLSGYSLDPFFSNQFDISHDISCVAKELPNPIYATNLDIEECPPYCDILQETQDVYKRFLRAEEETFKVLLVRNRQRAAAYQKALIEHKHRRRGVGAALSQFLSQSLAQPAPAAPPVPRVMRGTTYRVRQVGLELCIYMLVLYIYACVLYDSYMRLISPNATLATQYLESPRGTTTDTHTGGGGAKPWFSCPSGSLTAGGAGGGDRYPEDGAEGQGRVPLKQAAAPKLKASFSVGVSANASLHDPKASTGSKTSWNHGLSGGVYKLWSDSLVWGKIWVTIIYSPILLLLPIPPLVLLLLLLPPLQWQCIR